MKSLQYITLVIVILTSALVKAQDPETVGKTNGDLSVSLTGAATYSVPFTLPKGVNGMTPSIGLAYNSQAGDGIAGWGWNLSGLSSITRTTTNLMYDDDIHPVDFSETDRFTLDGQRLILTKGTYGGHLSEYVTANYSNIVIKAFNFNGSNLGPNMFEVLAPDGTISYYQKQDALDAYIDWPLVSKIDPQGNVIIYKYKVDGKLSWIDTIEYGGNINKKTPHTNTVKFNYSEKVTAESSLVIAHFNFQRKLILKDVVVNSGKEQLRKYELKHSYISRLFYEELKEIQEYNTNNKTFSSPIRFEYGKLGSNAIDDGNFKFKDTPITPPSLAHRGNYDMITGDFDGDGRIDFVFKHKKDKSSYHIFTKLFRKNNPVKKTSGSFKRRAKYMFPFSVMENGKLNQAQGIATVNQQGIGKVIFDLYTGTGQHLLSKAWQSPTYTDDLDCKTTKENQINKKYISGDFNGDGVTDIIAIDFPYNKDTCTLINPLDHKDPLCDCIGTYQYDSKAYFVNLSPNISSFINSAGSLRAALKSQDEVYASDYTGDGKTELIHKTNGQIYVYGITKSNKLKLIIKIDNTHIKNNLPLFLGDFNGDGRTDFVTPVKESGTQWHFIISGGNHSNYDKNKIISYTFNLRDLKYEPSKFKDGDYIANYYLVNDFNGDGKSDMLVHNFWYNPKYQNSINKISIHRSATVNDEINGEYQRVNIFRNAIHSEQFEIFGEDTQHYEKGFPVFFDSSIKNSKFDYAHITPNRVATYQYREDIKSSMILSSVSNNNVKTHIRYKTLGTANTTNTTYNYPYLKINAAPAYRVVSRLDRFSENGMDVSRLFKYEGAVSHVKGLGFLGFETVKQTNWHKYGGEAGRIWSISKQNMLKRGLVDQTFTSLIETDTPGNNFIQKTDYNYITKELSNKVFVSFLRKKISIDNLKKQTATNTYWYGAHNLVTKIESIFNGGKNTSYLYYKHNPTARDKTYHIGRLTKKATYNVIDGNDHSTEIKMTYNNNLLNESIKKGHNTPEIKESFIYDSFGNVTKRTLTAGGKTRSETFTYDTSGRYLESETDIEGLTTTHSYDKNKGILNYTINPFNQKTTYKYDGWQRLIKETDYLGNSTETLFELTPAPGGDTSTRITITYSDGQITNTDYNSMGLVVHEKKLGLEGKKIHKHFIYNEIGQLRKESEPYFSGSDLKWTETSYDDYGRVINVKLPSGKTITSTYSGSTTTVSDGTETKSTTVNGANKITSVTDNGGTITYKYFGNGEMQSASYGSHIVRIERDGWGRKTKLIDPSAGTYTYEYDSFGALTAENSPNGSTYYKYDDFGKLTNKNTFGDNAIIQRYYNYDAKTKQLTEVSSNGDNGLEYTYKYIYDNNRRLKNVKEDIYGQATFEKELIYDNLGRIINENYSTSSSGVSNTVKISYDFEAASGRLKAIKDAKTNTTLWQIDKENAKEQALQETLGNTYKTTFTYDDFGFLEQLTSGNSTNTVLDLVYNFDAKRGILLDRENKSLNKPWKEVFTFDNQDRLQQISGPKPDTKTYDQRGRIEQSSALGTYTYSNNALYQLKDIALNDNGDLYYQNHKVQDIVYNSFKKPLSIHEEGNGRVDFDYGPMDNRSFAYYGGDNEEKNQRNFTKIYSNIIPVEVLKNNKNNDVEIITYIGGDAYSAPVANKKLKTGNTTNDNFYYLHRDYLGSVLTITNQDGNVEEYRQFGAWGSTDYWVNGNYETITNGGLLAGRGFTGHEHFDSVSLIHMNGRMYDAKLGRFLSPDNYMQEPFSTKSFNRYSYVWNNPLNYGDPSGEWVHILIGAAVGGLINLGIKAYQGKIDSWGAGLKAFGVGAVAGGIGAATGGAAFTAAGGAAAGGGGFLAGFAGGAVGSAFSMPFQNIGNAIFFNDPLMSGKDYLKGIFFGGLTGGIVNGGIASYHGRSFWNGNFTPVGKVNLHLSPGEVATKELTFPPKEIKLHAEVPRPKAPEIYKNTPDIGRSGNLNIKPIEPSAKLSTNGVKLNEHLRQLEKYGNGGFKNLQNGKIRYYSSSKQNSGDLNLFRSAREWNPSTGNSRTWMETLNPAGKVIQVRPEFNNGNKTHYLFNELGKYIGKW